MSQFTIDERKAIWQTLSAIARKFMTKESIDNLTECEQYIDRDTLNQWIDELDSETTDNTH